MKPRSYWKLSIDEKSHWLSEARKTVYRGLEPKTDEKEKQVEEMARELYRASLTAD